MTYLPPVPPPPPLSPPQAGGKEREGGTMPNGRLWSAAALLPHGPSSRPLPLQTYPPYPPTLAGKGVRTMPDGRV